MSTYCTMVILPYSYEAGRLIKHCTWSLELLQVDLVLMQYQHLGCLRLAMEVPLAWLRIQELLQHFSM